MHKLILLLAISSLALTRAETWDRLALSINQEIVTEGDILRAIRTTAFLNGEATNFSAGAKRSAAQKLLELILIRQEIQLSRYPPPTAQQVDAAFNQVIQQRFGSDQAKYLSALKNYGITEKDLIESLRWQLVTLSFIEFRFRPAVQIQEEELLEFYQENWRKEYAELNPNKPVPQFNDVRTLILELMTQQRIDNLLDRWLAQAETQSRVRWIENVFQESRRP